MQEIDPRFGARLKAIRKMQKLTLEAAGAKLGISSAQLSDYENNRRNPSAMRVADFANFYGVSTDYLLGVNEDPQKTKVHDPKDEATLAHFISTIKKLSMDKFKVAVNQVNEYRALFEKLERHDVPTVTCPQTGNKTKKRKK